MSEATEQQPALPISAALCVDPDAFQRFGGVLRHLLVGLVDQAVYVRLLSSDPRVEKLTLGPVQTLVHRRRSWPRASYQIHEILPAMSSRPPTIVHAMSSASYRVGRQLAEALDADLILQATSLADCDALADLSTERARRYVAFTKPLQLVLEEQLHLPADHVELIRPGVLASQRVACFARPQTIPTVLCPSPLERGTGVDQLLEAVHLLVERGRTLMLFLLGTGFQEAAFRRFIRNRHLTTYVTLARPTRDMDYVLRSADLFVRPSSDTAFSEDIMQAMAAGLAVVTVRGGIYDFLHGDETAVLCDKPTADHLADAMDRLLQDPGFAQRIGRGGMEFVRSHHAVSHMAERVTATYRALALSRATFPLKEKL